jgi:phosphoribosylglycinamide formyltransferase-1
MIRLAILGSGSGSNALNIIEKCKERSDIKVSLIVCNVPGAGILQHAENNGITAVTISS